MQKHLHRAKSQPGLSWAVTRGPQRKTHTGLGLFTRSSALFSVLSCLVSGPCKPFWSWPSPTPSSSPRSKELSPAYLIPACPAVLQSGGCALTHSVPQNQPGRIFCSFCWSRPVLSGLIPSPITSDSFGFGLFPEEEMGG